MVVMVKTLAAQASRRLVRAWWLGRYWLLWKHRRAALAVALMAVPAVVAFAVARELYAPAEPGAPMLAYMWLYYAAVLVVALVLAYALAPKPQLPDAQQAERPHVKDGAGIVRVYGEVWIDDPVVLAWKQIGVDPIQRGGKK